MRRSADPERMEAMCAELASDLTPVYWRRCLRANGMRTCAGYCRPASRAAAVERGGSAVDRPSRLHHLLERTC